jgi:SAM-dependent methyltransferase
VAITAHSLLTLQKLGVVTPETRRILDIGSQNLYYLQEDQARKFLHNAGRKMTPEVWFQVQSIIRRSDPEASGPTSFLGELLELAGFEYVSLDLCAGYRTDICDMNHQPVPFRLRGQFDLVLNVGTTEHILNQLNGFSIMHDALKVGGYIYSILPTSGYLDHGYFTYTPKFYRDLAEANGYEFIEHFVCLATTKTSSILVDRL